LTPAGVNTGDTVHNVGVFYWGSPPNWAIFNVDTSAMPVNSAFNVLVIKN